MALPTTGQISLNDVRGELGLPTQAPFKLKDAIDGVYVALNTNSPTLPTTGGTYKLSNWYGYCHDCGGIVPCGTSINPFNPMTEYVVELGTTSGVVDFSSDFTSCPTAFFTVYYPAAAISSNIIFTSSTINDVSFNYVYNGSDTTVLVIFNDSPC